MALDLLAQALALCWRGMTVVRGLGALRLPWLQRVAVC